MVLLATAIRLCLGALFLVAGASKLLRQPSIRHVIGQYRLLRPAMVAPAALALGVAETGVGAILMLAFVPPLAAPAVASAAMLLCLFSAAIASALLRGIVVPCGCSLMLNGHVVSWVAFARNQVLLALLLAGPLIGSGAAS